MKVYGKIFYLECKDLWVLERAEPHVLIKLKSIFTNIRKNKIHHIPFKNTPEVCCDLKWFMDRYPLEMTDEDRERLYKGDKQHKANVNEIERILAPNYTPRDIEFENGKLRVYQSQGVEFIEKTKRAIIGDAVGLGKTWIGMGLIPNKDCLPMAIVLQAHLPPQWIENIETVVGKKVRIHYVNTRKPYNLPEADVYIMKYSCIIGWADVFQLGMFKSVVFDEIQELRSRDSQRHRCSRILSESADYVVGLSATPIYNYGDEAFNLFDLVSPGCLGSWEDFSREWISGYREVKDPKALGTYLREKQLFLRRTKEDVGEELPGVNKIVHHVGFDEGAMIEMEKLAKVLAHKALSGSFIEQGQAKRELDIMVRQATGVSKAKYVAEYVKIFLENNEPVVLCGWHREVYDIWLRELGYYVPRMYTGSESALEKEKSKKMFINGETNLLILSLRSGIGLDGLQKRCSTIIKGELDWSPAIHEQLTGRLDRDGQTKVVDDIYLVSNSGSDPLLVDLLGLKSNQQRGIIDPFSTDVTNQRSDTSRLKQLAQYILDRKK